MASSAVLRKKGILFQNFFSREGPLPFLPFFFSAEYFLSWPVQRRSRKLQTSDAYFHEKKKSIFFFFFYWSLWRSSMFLFILLLEAFPSFLGSTEMLFGKRGEKKRHHTRFCRGGDLLSDRSSSSLQSPPPPPAVEVRRGRREECWQQWCQQDCC